MPTGKMHPAGFATTMDGAQMLTTWWPPTSDNQLWVLLSGLGQHSWDASVPFLFIPSYCSRRHCVVGLVKMDSNWTSHWPWLP